MKPSGHRVLYNGDCNTFFYNPKQWQPEGGPYSAKAIHRFVDLLADSGVDTFLVNTSAQKASYPSKIFPTVLDGYKRGDREFFRGHAVAAGVPAERIDRYLDMFVDFMNLYVDLEDAGIDWIAETAAHCRRRAISPWASIRMNDMHGAKNPAGSYMNCALFADPQNRLHQTALPGEDDVNYYRSGLNYGVRAVRDYMMIGIRDIVENYDYEGLELDWLRNPLCCEPEASADVIEDMLEWLGEVRAVTEARARRSGRPYPLGIRMPADLGLMRTIGLDVKEMARRKLIDFIGPSNFWQTSWDVAHDTLKRELGDDVAVYGVVEDAPNWVYGFAPSSGKTGIRYLSASAQLLRANAAGKLALGADGIELYNFFCTDPSPHDTSKLPGMVCDYSGIRGLDDLTALRGQTKHYAFATMRTDTTERQFETVSALPVYIEPKFRRSFRLGMCSEPAAKGLTLTIQVVLEKTTDVPNFGVSFNGSWLHSGGTPTGVFVYPVGPCSDIPAGWQGYNFTFEVERISEGWNSVVVYNNNQPGKTPLDNAIRVISIEMGIG